MLTDMFLASSVELERNDADTSAAYATENPALLMALPSLGSRLLLDAAEIDLSD